jgi:hypothetical protein
MLKITNRNGFFSKPVFLLLFLMTIICQPLNAITQWPITAAGSLTYVTGANITITTSNQTSSTIPNGKASYWSFAGVAGTSYYFVMTGTSGQDMSLAIFDGLYSSGTSKLVAANDDKDIVGGNYKSGLTFICPVSQTYYILCHSNLSPYTFPASATLTIILNYMQCGAVASVASPFNEDWSASNTNTACSNWIQHGNAMEADWFINNAAWVAAYGWPYGLNLAGGAGNELILPGSQYDIYGLGSVGNRTATITSMPINTSGVATMTFSWKHSMQTNGDNGINGSNTIILKLQSSGDLITWNDEWSGSYTVGASATTQIPVTTMSKTINIGANVITYLRFYANGVLGKMSWWAIDAGNAGVVVLPIELENFSAKLFKDGDNNNAKTKVEWTTASETHNDYFTIERSTDGKEYAAIKTVKGAGNSQTKKSYSIVDENPFVGVNYYRLKQTDLNGVYKYFDARTVLYETKALWFGNLIPNPATSEVSFNLYSPLKSIAKVQLIDISGRVIFDKFEEISEGNQVINTQISEIANGIYYLKVSVDEMGYSHTVKLVKN